MCGFCNVWVCVCVGFMCGCVYVRVLCVVVCMCGFYNVWFFVCVCFVLCGIVGFVMCGCVYGWVL